MTRRADTRVRLLVGCTGPNAAGKGEVLKYLMSRGFSVLSLSDVIREEAERRGIPESREAMIALGNQLRKRYGPAVLALRSIRRIRRSEADLVAVDSIRAVAEVEALRTAFGDRFVLLGITAPARRRFAFLKARQRPGDPRTLGEMLRLEKQERGASSFQQQLDRVWGMRDVTIVNRGSLVQLHERVDRLARSLLRRISAAESATKSVSGAKRGHS
jgi:dephospho-CoA kinase